MSACVTNGDLDTLVQRIADAIKAAMTLGELRDKYRQFGVFLNSDCVTARVLDNGWRVCEVDLSLPDDKIEEKLREGVATYKLEMAFKTREAARVNAATRARP